MKKILFLTLLLPLVMSAQNEQGYHVKYNIKNKLDFKLPNDSLMGDIAVMLYLRMNVPDFVYQTLNVYSSSSQCILKHTNDDRNIGALAAVKNQTSISYIDYQKNIHHKKFTYYLAPHHFSYTGQDSTILGYKCKVAIPTDTSATSPTALWKIWVCEDLPMTLHPFIIVEGVKGAILRAEPVKPNGTIFEAMLIEKTNWNAHQFTFTPKFNPKRSHHVDVLSKNKNVIEDEK